MASLNLCQFIGNVGKIETRFMQNGDAVTNLSLACNETWKDKSTGEKQERCEWVNVTIYRKLAEIAEKYVSKGDPLYVSGKMQTRKYTDKSGADRYTTEIIANDMKMLGNRQESKPDQGSNAQQSKAATGSGFSDMEDDIPF